MSVHLPSHPNSTNHLPLTLQLTTATSAAAFRTLFGMSSKLLLLIITCFYLACLTRGNCYKPCRFTFCTYAAAQFAVGLTPNEPFTSILCMPQPATKEPRVRLGKVQAFGEAWLVNRTHGGPLRMSQWRACQSDVQPLPNNFFTPFAFASTPYSGVAHAPLQKGQKTLLNTTCWALPIVAYNIIDDNDHVLQNIYDSSKPLQDCVALETFVF